MWKKGAVKVKKFLGLPAVVLFIGFSPGYPLQSFFAEKQKQKKDFRFYPAAVRLMQFYEAFSVGSIYGALKRICAFNKPLAGTPTAASGSKIG